jgi:hypothetical protein
MWLDMGNATDERSLSWYFAQHSHGCFQTDFRKQQPDDRQIGVVKVHDMGGDDIVNGGDSDLKWSKPNRIVGRLLSTQLWVGRNGGCSSGTPCSVPHRQLIRNDESTLDKCGGEQDDDWQNNCEFNGCLASLSAFMGLSN